MVEKGGQRQEVKAFKKPNWPNLNLIFCKKIILFTTNFKLEIKFYWHAQLGFQSWKKKFKDKN
jgi:hypothetical protein